MTYELTVLRAISRLARRHIALVELEPLLQRVGGDMGTLRAALRSLERAGLVSVHFGGERRLTLAGLAAAAASAPPRVPAHLRRPTHPSRAA